MGSDTTTRHSSSDRFAVLVASDGEQFDRLLERCVCVSEPSRGRVSPLERDAVFLSPARLSRPSLQTYS
ncbi:hypothetical protein EL22_10965 [Halostagnicola sp. A56]|nr:hypothetical protein EL22_10965 [Halostagnicola sp. A56]